VGGEGFWDICIHGTKNVFSVASLSFEGDLPAALFHLGLIMDDIDDWKAKFLVIAIFHTNAGHVTLHDQALWLVRIKNTCLSGRSHSSKSDLVSSLGLASGRALPMRSEFRLGLPCRREFARVAAQIFSGTLNSIVGDRYA